MKPIYTYLLAWLLSCNTSFLFAQSEHPYVHDPSAIIKNEDTYWYFSTGWGITPAFSKDLKHWETKTPSIFKKGEHPAWIDSTIKGFKGHFWAPDVIFMNGKYHVYYSCSTFGSPTSAIGLVTSSSLNPDSRNYGWTDQGMVVKSQEKKDFNAIDPSILKDDDGRVYMVYGSFHAGIAGVELDTLTGKTKAGSTLSKLAGGRESDWEASCLIREGKYYYLFVNNGLCCKGLNSTYYIVVGRSENPLGPFVDQSGRKLTEGGGTALLRSQGDKLGPGHVGLLREGKKLITSIHYYDATEDGKSKLTLINMKFKNGWPVLSWE